MRSAFRIPDIPRDKGELLSPGSQRRGSAEDNGQETEVAPFLFHFDLSFNIKGN